MGAHCRTSVRKKSDSTTFSLKNRPSGVVCGAVATEMVWDSSLGGTVHVKTGWEDRTTAPGAGDTGDAAACATPAITSAPSPTGERIVLPKPLTPSHLSSVPARLGLPELK